MRRLRHSWSLLGCCIVLLSSTVAECSLGDVLPGFQQCLAVCLQTGCTNAVEATCSGLCPGLADRHVIPIFIRALAWDCQADCKYNCMWKEELLARARPPAKYYGKWAFRRWGGMQEPLSVLFSLVNLGAHARAYRRLRKRCSFPPQHAPLLRLWGRFFALSAACWGSSAAFHARDTPATERADYLCAAAMLGFSVYACVARISGPGSGTARLVAVVLAAGLLHHARHMLFVHFDYGLHMQVCVALGALQSLLWVVWTQATRHPRRWALLGLVVGVHVSSLLELLDFAPVGGLLDAHALWHACTPPATLLWYGFLGDDYLMVVARESSSGASSTVGNAGVGAQAKDE